jgi:site-specific DNA-adenine methylase
MLEHYSESTDCMVNIAIELQCKKNFPDVFKTICPVFGGGGAVVICMNLQSILQKLWILLDKFCW